MPVVPSRLREITPENVTALLNTAYPGVVVDRVEVAEYAHCGDGLASTADRIGLRLHYRDGTNPSRLPEAMKLKSIFLHRWLRFGMPMILGTAAAVNVLEKIPVFGRAFAPAVFTLINLYQRFFPHAPVAMYRNEVQFYARIRPELTIEAPASYASVIDEADGRFGILMEDLTARGARFPSAVRGVSLEEMRSLIENLAALHARYWQSPRLDGDLHWLPKTFEGGMFPVFDAFGLNIIRDQVAKNPFKQRLIAPLQRSVDELWGALWKSQRIIYRQPLTLLHGDPHVGNTYILPGGKGGLLDWQLMVKGPWCQDVTYLLVTGLSVDARREHERALLRVYCDALGRQGVDRVPGEDEAFLLYRQTAIWGLVIGWLITPPQNYGEEITTANIEKTVAAMVDLRTLESLDA